MCQVCGMKDQYNFLGRLGDLIYYTCRYCGMQFYTKDKEKFINAEDD
jgi:hypothetical protein